MADTYITNSARQTRQIAFKVAQRLKGAGVICINGQLGAGKTVFIKAIAEYFSYPPDEVLSNSYITFRSYKADIEIYHFDAYRSSAADFPWDEFYVGLERKALILIEWAENIKDSLPCNAVNIEIKVLDRPNLRKITIKGLSLGKHKIQRGGSEVYNIR